MNISQRFNRYLHVVLTQCFRHSRQVSFREWKDTETGGCLIFYKNEDYGTMDELKHVFKLMDLNYPLDKDSKISTRDITSKELTRHIEFVLKIMAENGTLLPIVEEEWQRLLEQAGIER